MDRMTISDEDMLLRSEAGEHSESASAPKQFEDLNQLPTGPFSSHRSSALVAAAALLGLAGLASLGLSDSATKRLTTAPGVAGAVNAALPKAGVVQKWGLEPKQCGSAQCDCAWASQPDACSNSFEQSDCFKCCCGEGLGIDRGYGSRGHFVTFGNGYDSMGQGEAYHGSRPVPVHVYGNHDSGPEPVHIYGNNHVVRYHPSFSCVLLWWVLLFVVLVLLTCVGLYLFLKPQK